MVLVKVCQHDHIFFSVRDHIMGNSCYSSSTHVLQYFILFENFFCNEKSLPTTVFPSFCSLNSLKRGPLTPGTNIIMFWNLLCFTLLEWCLVRILSYWIALIQVKQHTIHDLMQPSYKRRNCPYQGLSFPRLFTKHQLLQCKLSKSYSLSSLWMNFKD